MTFVNQYGNVVKVTDDHRKAEEYLRCGYTEVVESAPEEKPESKTESRPRKAAKKVIRDDG